MNKLDKLNNQINGAKIEEGKSKKTGFKKLDNLLNKSVIDLSEIKYTFTGGAENFDSEDSEFTEKQMNDHIKWLESKGVKSLIDIVWSPEDGITSNMGKMYSELLAKTGVEFSAKEAKYSFDSSAILSIDSKNHLIGIHVRGYPGFIIIYEYK